jgi:hypothetical protein
MDQEMTPLIDAEDRVADQRAGGLVGNPVAARRPFPTRFRRIAERPAGGREIERALAALTNTESNIAE